MPRRVKIVLQATAVLVVALLLALLGWQVFRTDQGRALDSKVKHGQRPAAPTFTSDPVRSNTCRTRHGTSSSRGRVE